MTTVRFGDETEALAFYLTMDRLARELEIGSVRFADPKTLTISAPINLVRGALQGLFNGTVMPALTTDEPDETPAPPSNLTVEGKQKAIASEALAALREIVTARDLRNLRPGIYLELRELVVKAGVVRSYGRPDGREMLELAGRIAFQVDPGLEDFYAAQSQETVKQESTLPGEAPAEPREDAESAKAEGTGLDALARICYEAYRDYLVKARPDYNSMMFHWEQLPEKYRYREAWKAAISTALHHVESSLTRIAETERKRLREVHLEREDDD